MDLFFLDRNGWGYYDVGETRSLLFLLFPRRPEKRGGGEGLGASGVSLRVRF